MLTYNEKLAIIESFSELERKNVSLGRVNFQFEGSISDKKNIVYHLHPNGNGFVYAGQLDHYDTDEKGMVNIRDFSEDQLRKLLKQSIQSLSSVEKTPAEEAIIGDSKEERWVDSENNVLILVEENESWNIYYGLNLDATFDTYEEAEAFLQEEGFTRK
ncbi:hypothetical protein J7E79_17605 [Bacillus sp. ISL-40]|uniref:hypothetical protein n=1 Tax=unclassified Bacillus (in: firmicutes) TaxID=185979 RepID=UPI001BE6A206|nr:MULTISPECIES: hypothetical protein [unclassified Bacillus (in: firmicutes)]MBT2699203.1 hypothetical protein [Bacillus sp. ISL-40]MBT2723530.1 hypothetical protein [Bacillus sp. ISL-46]MBT2739601.1 hypothetical protein [Bacillus sp. ISL-77]